MHESNLARTLSGHWERDPVIALPHEQPTVVIPVELKLVRALHARSKATSRRRKHLQRFSADSGIYQPYRAF